MSVNAVNKQTGSLLPLAGAQTYQYTGIPPANLDNLNKIIQYVGTTTSSYINGYFYKCVLDTSVNPNIYKWENVPVSENIGGITKTITIYSAAVDTVSFIDFTGETKTVTTDSDGEGSVSISYFQGMVIEFTSSVAKNPDDLAVDYSRKIELSADTTEIYVMPDNVLYWYGYKSSDFETFTSANGWSDPYNATLIEPTFNTNYAHLEPGASGRCSGLCKKTVMSTGSTVKVVYKNYSVNIVLIREASKTISYSDQVGFSEQNVLALGETAVVSGKYLAIVTPGTRNADIYALWLGDDPITPSKLKYITKNVTLSTSGTTTVTFTGADITSDKIIEVYAGRSTGDVNGAKNQFPHKSIYTTTGSCTVIFPKESTAININVALYIRG